MLELFIRDFIDMFVKNPIAQAFGILWMCIILYGFFQTDDKKAKSIIAFSMLAWIMHFFLMGLMTATIATIIWFVRMLLSLKFQKNKYVFFGIVVVSVAFWYLSYESMFHLLPIVATIAWAFSFMFFEKILFRFATLLTTLIWLYYNINIWSLWWVTNWILTEFILIITILRMAWREGHLHHYKEMFHDIIHKHKDVDMWNMVIIKDSHKIIKSEGYFGKIFKKLKNIKVSDWKNKFFA